MRALVLYAPGDLRLEEVPVPEPEAGTVLLEVAWCGVCGSNIPRIFTTGAHRHPIVPGHEFAGVVAALGAGVDDWRIGEAAVPFPLIWCGKCAECETGHYARCADYDYLGSRSDGGFAEYVVCPVRNLRHVPAGVELAHAAMTEPAAVALHALRRTGLQLVGETVAVFGAGPIGTLVAQWARVLGAEQTLLFDVVEHRLSRARQMGMAHAINSAATEPVEAIRRLTDGRGAAICVEAAGVPQTVVQACGALRSGGTLVLLGNPSADVVLPREVVSGLLRKEANVVGVWNSTFLVNGSGDDWETALRAMAEGRLQMEPLISHRVSLEEGVETLRSMAERRGTFDKVLIGG
jgi:L-iditol 2-dehydrogenase